MLDAKYIAMLHTVRENRHPSLVPQPKALSFHKKDPSGQKVNSNLPSLYLKGQRTDHMIVLPLSLCGERMRARGINRLE